jgi:hypothetical protein
MLSDTLIIRPDVQQYLRRKQLYVEVVILCLYGNLIGDSTVITIAFYSITIDLKSLSRMAKESIYLRVLLYATL